MSLKHELYSVKHSGKIDADAWARLINTKLSKPPTKPCTTGEDLISKWHHKGASNIEALQKKESAAVRKWTGEIKMP